MVHDLSGVAISQLQSASAEMEPHMPASGCRRFTNTLAIMVWLSVAWIAYEMYYKVRPPFPTPRQDPLLVRPAPTAECMAGIVPVGGGATVRLGCG